MAFVGLAGLAASLIGPRTGLQPSWLGEGFNKMKAQALRALPFFISRLAQACGLARLEMKKALAVARAFILLSGWQDAATIP